MQCAKKNVVSLIRNGDDHAAVATAWEAPDIQSAMDLVEPEPTAEEIALQQAFDEARAQGMAEGHAEGLEKGRAEGFDAGKAEAEQQVLEQGRQQQEAHQAEQDAFKQRAEETLQTLNQLIDAIKNPLESQLDETVNEAIATLTYQISKQVVKSELEINPEHIGTVVKELFQQLPMTEREVSFFLNPEDKALIESGVQLTSGAFEWKLEADEQIARGGCHVESRNFSVDETVEARLAQSVRKVFGLSSEALSTDPESAEEPEMETAAAEVQQEAHLEGSTEAESDFDMAETAEATAEMQADDIEQTQEPVPEEASKEEI